MSKTIIPTLILFMLFAAGCDEDNPYEDFTKEQLSKSMSEKYEAILAFAQPTSCTDPTEWHLTEVESVCYPFPLAYHESVDKRKLTALIQDYDLLIEVYRPLIAPYVDCLGYGEPKGVACVEGKPLVQY